MVCATNRHSLVILFFSHVHIDTRHTHWCDVTRLKHRHGNTSVSTRIHAHTHTFVQMIFVLHLWCIGMETRVFLSSYSRLVCRCAYVCVYCTHCATDTFAFVCVCLHWIMAHSYVLHEHYNPASTIWINELPNNMIIKCNACLFYYDLFYVVSFSFIEDNVSCSSTPHNFFVYFYFQKFYMVFLSSFSIFSLAITRKFNHRESNVNMDGWRRLWLCVCDIVWVICFW